jgi:hypothetical protein
MAAQRWVLFLLAAAMTALAGCGGGTTFNVQNPSAPPGSGLSIAVQTVPAATAAGQPVPLLVTGAMTLTATVKNDPNNYGVDWSVTCSVSGNCGTLSASHTASGTAVTYTPPSTLLGNTQPVNIVALATEDHTVNTVAPVNVTGFGVGNINAGNYVLQAKGVDNAGGSTYQFAGVIALDGNGNITGGEQTVNFYDANPAVKALVSKSDAITGGSYFLGPDGRGTILIDTADTDIGYSSNASQEGIETFTFVFLNSPHALIAQMDLQPPGASQSTKPLANTGSSATGTMDLQTSTAAPAGGYAFVASGTEIAGLLPAAFGGVLNISSNTILTTGSVIDQILPGTIVTSPVTVNAGATVSSGQVTVPDSFGMFTLTLSVPSLTSSPIQFTGYIVDTTHIGLIESDLASTTPVASTAGIAVAQALTSGSFTDTSFSGPYVFGILGIDLGNPAQFIVKGTPPDQTTFVPATTSNTLNSVGEFTAAGSASSSNLTVIADTVLQQWTNVATGAQGKLFSSDDYVGNYSVDAAGTGRGELSFSTAGSTSFVPQYFFYLTGNGGYNAGPASSGNCPNDTADNGNCPVLVLTVGAASGTENFPFLGVGIAYPQAPSASLTFGNSTGSDYGFSFTQVNGAPGSTSENDGTAQMSVDMTTAAPAAGATSAPFSFSLSGVADFNDDFVATIGTGPDQPFTNDTSVKAYPPKNGLFKGTLLGANTTTVTSNVFPTTVAVDYYIIDPNFGFFIETDLLNQTGYFQTGQVSFGYYAVRQVLATTPTTTALTSSQNPSVAGQSVTFTAIVTPGGSSSETPGGTVSFNDGTTPLCNAPLSGGQATCANIFISGTYTITATYNGDVNFTGSSASCTQEVGTTGSSDLCALTSAN